MRKENNFYSNMFKLLSIISLKGWIILKMKKEINIFKPTLELGMIATVLFFLIMLAQIVGKGCHSIEMINIWVMVASGMSCYILWRNMK